MALSYFTGLSDKEIAQEVIAKTPDLYIQKREYGGCGIYALETGGASTLTPSTSPAWSVDEFASTVADNILIIDDNGKVATGKITSNAADSVTFDETALVLEEDGTTAPTFTAGTEYNFRVYTPSSTAGNVWGPFFGLVEGAELSITDTLMKFKYSIPKKMLFQDMEEREGMITGGHVNFVSEDVAKTIFGATEYGDQTSQTALAIGSDPDTDLFYRLVFDGEDRSNRDWYIRTRDAQFELTGNVFSKAESGHFMAPFTASLLADPFYPDDANMLAMVRAD